MKEFYIVFGCGFAVAIWLVAVGYSLSFIGYYMNYTECTICGCMPKPDEWSGQVQGVCFDCG